MQYLKLTGIALLIAVLGGCSTVSEILPTGSSTDTEATNTTEENAPEAAGNTYLASDEYREDDEIRGTLLTRSDYAKMTEEIVRNDVEFDWGWIAPGLDLSQYASVRVTVQNDSNSLDPNIKSNTRKTFSRAMQRLGLNVVSSGADLELAIAIVDYSAEYTYAFVTMIKPFVELELRLTNLHTGADLVLIRNQEHSMTPEHAVTEYASDFMQFMR